MQWKALMQWKPNFTKNKLLKRVNSMKIYFLFAGINLEKTKRQKNARFMDDALKTKGIENLNVETWLLP